MRTPPGAQNPALQWLAALVPVALAAGAAGALGLTLYTGRRNPSLLLMALFAVWVLAPFAGLAAALAVSKGWPFVRRAALYGLIPLVTLGTLALYANVAFGPPRASTAFTFLVVPAASWLLIGIDLLAARLVSGRLSR